MLPRPCWYVLADGGVPLEKTFDLQTADGLDKYWETLQKLACDDSVDAGLWPFASIRKVSAEVTHPRKCVSLLILQQPEPHGASFNTTCLSTQCVLCASPVHRLHQSCCATGEGQA